MRKYKTLNNRICKEIVRLSIVDYNSSLANERSRISAIRMLSFWFDKLEDSVLFRLWDMVGQYLFDYCRVEYIGRRIYNVFFKVLVPKLKKGGVFMYE